ncbi:hypothetical protein PF011_g28046 [Phytophthora fragariae]|uniref:ZSWIM1/3 RNaseH-like domain-containing protein n=2 Tax=Phytophthora fragariae TaxID=53985 RepID=A0A6A3H8Y9_9STRA|nr:hypothetical protein PF011_g28046 [Phytophthora fragariae]
MGELRGNRTVKDSQLAIDVAVLHKAGANAKGILQYLRERTGKKTILRDVHNMLQRMKTKENAGLTDAQRAISVQDEFCGQDGCNSAEVLVDSDTNVARVLTFQTAKMKRLFKAFPEVVMVDSTHNTNENRYKLFSFVVHDVFGKGQYVHHALRESEHKVNLRKVIEIFKRDNPSWNQSRVIMTDKAVHEKDVLQEMFPDARQLLCQGHIVTWLKKQVARLAPGVKKEVKALMSLLVYARSRQEYEDARGCMLEKLGGDTSHPLYKTFMENWDNSQEEWVAYRRGNVPHLTNNTNNRIESKWGAEEQYLAEYHRVGRRPHDGDEDPELASLALQISPFAFDLVAKQHALATGPDADYDFEHGQPGSATLTSTRTGNTYKVNSMRSIRNCIFMQTCLLPCRHILFVRSKCNYETIIPPMRFFSTRWIVHIPANNIGEGDIPRGGLRQATCPPLSKQTPVTSVARYCQTIALTEMIVDRMALQSTPTFQVAFRWLEDFYEALNAGDVVTFTERDDSAFPGLSHVSSVGGARLSQLSFANRETPEGQSSADIDADIVDNGVEVDIAVDISSDVKAEEVVTVQILPNRAAVPGE